MKSFKILALLVAISVMCGCGGSGSDAPTVQPPTVQPPTTPPVVEPPVVEPPVVEPPVVEPPVVEPPVVQPPVVERPDICSELTVDIVKDMTDQQFIDDFILWDIPNPMGPPRACSGIFFHDITIWSDDRMTMVLDRLEQATTNYDNMVSYQEFNAINYALAGFAFAYKVVSDDQDKDSTSVTGGHISRYINILADFALAGAIDNPKLQGYPVPSMEYDMYAAQLEVIWYAYGNLLSNYENSYPISWIVEIEATNADRYGDILLLVDYSWSYKDTIEQWNSINPNIDLVHLGNVSRMVGVLSQYDSSHLTVEQHELLLLQIDKFIDLYTNESHSHVKYRDSVSGAYTVLVDYIIDEYSQDPVKYNQLIDKYVTESPYGVVSAEFVYADIVGNLDGIGCNNLIHSDQLCDTQQSKANWLLNAFPDTDIRGDVEYRHNGKDVDYLESQLAPVRQAFFDITGASTPVDQYNNDYVTLVLYDNQHVYARLGGWLHNIPTNNGGIYIESITTMFTYDRVDGLALEELLRHEYGHYLISKYLVHGMWGEADFWQNDRLTWFDEGLANLLTGATDNGDIKIINSVVDQLQDSDIAISQVLNVTYGDWWMYHESTALFGFALDSDPTWIYDLSQALIADDIDLFEALAESFNTVENNQAFIDWKNDIAQGERVPDPWE